MRSHEKKPSDEVAHLVDKLKPSDFAPSETDEKLSDEQVRAIINMTHERAIYARQQGLWSPDQEAAYLNGAASVFFACKQPQAIPKQWLGMVGPEGVLGKLAIEKSKAPEVGELDVKARRARSKPSFGLDPEAQRRESKSREAAVQRRRAPHHGGATAEKS